MTNEIQMTIPLQPITKKNHQRIVVHGKRRIYLKTNKTQMVRLIQDKGYCPSLRKSVFEKAFRARSYWLTWMEDDGMHQALLMTAGGRTYLRVRNMTQDSERMIRVPLGELEKYKMTEVIEK